MPFGPMNETRPLMHPHGQVTMTAGVAHWIREAGDTPEGNRRADFVTLALGRHLLGDDGDTDAEDKALNAQAWQHGERVLSVYKLNNGLSADRDDRLWVITEWDRSVTTILFPSEY
jgi:hypothetical protein